METACNRFRTELSAFMDGQLDPKTTSDVQSHLSDCGGCADELETLKQLTKFLNEELHPEKVDVPELWGEVSGRMPSVCEVMLEDLSAYLDGELTPAAQEGVNQHLKDCAACLESFRELNATNRVLVKGLELSPEFKLDLWPAIKAQLNQDCSLVRSEVSAFVDQEVPTLHHRNITNHLLDCQDCRLEFNQISSVGDLLRDSYKPAMADDFDLWPGIKSKLQVVPFAPKGTAKTKPNRTRFLAAAAAAVIGVCGLAATLTLQQPASSATMSSEAYLIESALVEPSDVAEAVVYDQ